MVVGPVFERNILQALKVEVDLRDVGLFDGLKPGVLINIEYLYEGQPG